MKTDSTRGVEIQNSSNEISSQPEENRISKFKKARPYLILSPAFLLTIGILIPFGMAIYFSMTNYSFKYPTFDFVWFQNYIQMFQSKSFWHGVGVTLSYSGLATLIETVLGVSVALLLNRKSKLANSLRIVLIFPLVIAPVI